MMSLMFVLPLSSLVDAATVQVDDIHHRFAREMLQLTTQVSAPSGEALVEQHLLRDHSSKTPPVAVDETAAVRQLHDEQLSRRVVDTAHWPQRGSRTRRSRRRRRTRRRVQHQPNFSLDDNHVDGSRSDGNSSATSYSDTSGSESDTSNFATNSPTSSPKHNNMDVDATFRTLRSHFNQASYVTAWR